MNSRLTYIALILAAVAVCAWGGVIYFAWSIGETEAARAAEIQDAQQSAVQQNSTVRVHAIAQDTAQDRARLDTLLTTDIVSAANMLKGVGRTTHVDVKLSGALPETAPPSTPNGPQIQAVGFALEGNGTFSALMRTVQLLETLPLASSLLRLDIQRAQNPAGSATDSWHMSVYLRVFTTTNISS